jgi:hypothetical protein
MHLFFSVHICHSTFYIHDLGISGADLKTGDAKLEESDEFTKHKNVINNLSGEF